MTQDEIIEMARQFCPYYSEELRGAYYDGFMKASKLVAQHEREACSSIASDYAQRLNSMTAVNIADAIRARGQA